MHGERESPLHKHESFMAYSSLVLAKKEIQRGEKKKKKDEKIASCIWHLLPNIHTEDSAILTQGKCVKTAR